MEWLEQKHGRCCGQNAVAMISGRPLMEIKTKIGKRGGTKTSHLAKVLREYGFLVPDKCISHTRTIGTPDLCLAQLRREGYSGWHWIAIETGIVYDGNRSGPMLLGDYIQYQKTQGWRITSYLPVSRPAAEFFQESTRKRTANLQ